MDAAYAAEMTLRCYKSFYFDATILDFSLRGF